MPKSLSELISQSKLMTAAASMLRAFRDSMLRSDLVTIALGLTLALTAWKLIDTFVGSLIAPLIAVFIGESHFELNAFTIGESQFMYGQLIEAAIAFVLAAALVYLFHVVPERKGYARDSVAGETRACPECTSSISVAAKRCPHCTAVIQPEVT